jgi:hypothetical protein
MINFVEDKSLLPKEKYISHVLKGRGVDCSTWMCQGTREKGHTIKICIFTKKGCLNLTFPWPFKKEENRYTLDLEDLIVKEFNIFTPIQVITEKVFGEYEFIQRLPKPKSNTKPEVHLLYLKHNPIEYKNIFGVGVDHYK